jgi:hypothetical protein
MQGSVKKYEKHLLLCTGGDPAHWPEKIGKKQGSYAQIVEDELALR